MTPAVPINYVAVAAAVVLNMLLGFLWYGPLFGKPWMKIMGINSDTIAKSKKKGMGKSLVLATLGSLVMVFVLAHSLVFASAYLHVSGPMAGVSAGFWNWLGFIAPVALSSVIWEGKPWTLWFINAGYYLVAMIAMGVVLSMGY